ncbi:hypothetical protein B0H19DRAFT_1124847 [Mycena capillaripes]|nr:hypothetical protein B0H19DRAFT_1124847 [Mycena capillaripes]
MASLPSIECGVASIPAALKAPDLTRLLRSNDIPLDSETLSIRDVVLKGQDIVDDLNDRIHELQATLGQLVRSRDEAVEKIRPYRAILSPVRRVPPELICEIFSMTQDSISSDDDEVGKAAPWYLGHICRSWRLCALGYSPLWTSITIPLSPAAITDTSLIKTQLIRSACAPLKVYWAAMENGDTPDPNVADLVVAQCHRWRVLCLDLCHRSVDLGWLCPRNGRITSLEKLILINGPDSVIPDIFSSAPNLRQAILTDYGLEWSPDNPHSLPWGQITHYRGTYTVQDQLTILRAALNLLQCAIGLGHEPDFEPEDGPPVTLPHVHSLWIDKPRFIPHLTTPSLENLLCEQSELPDLAVLSSQTFVLGPARSLTKLVLMFCDISPELITVLRGLPRLTFLVIDAHPYQPPTPEQETAFLDAMTISGSSHDLCPNLMFLGYGFVRPFPQDIFFTMAHSRNRPTQPGSGGLVALRLFYALTARGNCPAGIDTSMQMLRDAGLDAAFLGRFTLHCLRKKGYFQDYSFDCGQWDCYDPEDDDE